MLKVLLRFSFPEAFFWCFSGLYWQFSVNTLADGQSEDLRQSSLYFLLISGTVLDFYQKMIFFTLFACINLLFWNCQPFLVFQLLVSSFRSCPSPMLLWWNVFFFLCIYCSHLQGNSKWIVLLCSQCMKSLAASRAAVQMRKCFRLDTDMQICSHERTTVCFVGFVLVFMVNQKETSEKVNCSGPCWLHSTPVFASLINALDVHISSVSRCDLSPLMVLDSVPPGSTKCRH